MGRAKLANLLVESKSNRRECFNKRCKGLLKKAYELAHITGAGVRLIIEGEDGNIYDFHRRMKIELLLRARANDLVEEQQPDAEYFPFGNGGYGRVNHGCSRGEGGGGAPGKSTPPNLQANIDTTHKPMMEDGRTTPLSPRSSAPSSSKLTNRCMFFNGRSTMDTGFHVTQKIREYLSSEACRCFDCTRGYSRRLFETNGFDDSSPSLAGDDRPFFRKAAYMGKAYVQAFNESIAHGYASPVCPSRPDASVGALNPTDTVHLEVLDQADKNNAPSSSDQLPTNPHQQLCQTAQNQSLTLTQLEREGGDQMEAVAAQTMDGTLLASTTEDIFDFLATDGVDGNSFPPYEHKRHLSAEFGAILLIQNAGNRNLMCEEPECEQIEQMALPMLVSAQDTDGVHDSKSFPPFEHADYLIAKIAEMLSRNAENGNSIFAEIEQMALPMPSSAQGEADDVTKPREDRREATMFLNTDDEVNYDSIFNQQRCFNCGSKNCYDHKSCTYMGSMLTDQRNFADPTFW